MPGWAFTVVGLPGPQGSKDFMGRDKAGHAIMRESSRKVTPWREAVKAAGPAGPRLDGPLALYCVFTLKRPASARRSDQYPATRPDLSKLLRASEDALTDAGLIVDDARFVETVRLAKCWPGDDDALCAPGALLGAQEMTEQGWLSILDQRVSAALALHREMWNNPTDVLDQARQLLAN